MLMEEIKKILSKCEKCSLSECINCEMSYTERQKIRGYIENTEIRNKNVINKLELLLQDLKTTQELRKQNKVIFNEMLEAIRIKEILEILKKGENDA